MLRTILATSLGLLLVVGASAQTNEPEYVGVIAAHDRQSGTYTQLERQTPTAGHETRLGGFAGASTFYVFSGDKSSVRFKQGQAVEFVLRVDNQEKDPASFIQFFSLVPKDGNRILPARDAASIFSVASTDQATLHAIPFIAHKFGTKFFSFTPAQPLPPGEYSVSTVEDKDAFNFGIDP